MHVWAAKVWKYLWSWVYSVMSALRILCTVLDLTAESAVKLQVSSSSGKGVASSKGGKAPGSKAKDPIQERKEAQLADEAQVHKLLLYLLHSMLVCVLIS